MVSFYSEVPFFTRRPTIVASDLGLHCMPPNENFSLPISLFDFNIPVSNFSVMSKMFPGLNTTKHWKKKGHAQGHNTVHQSRLESGTTQSLGLRSMIFVPIEFIIRRKWSSQVFSHIACNKSKEKTRLPVFL